MSDRAKAIDDALEEVGQVGVRVLVMKGRAVDEGTEWGSIVAFYNEGLEEPEVLEVCPKLGDGLQGLLDWTEGWFEDLPDDGPAFTVSVETWTGADFDGVDASDE